jgi:hypothetical protein
MKIIIVFVLMISSSNMFGQTFSKIKIELKPYMELQNYEHFKRLVLISDENQIDNITNFELEWGYSFILLVNREELEYRLSDGTKYRYTLDKLLAKEKVSEDYSFQMTIDPNRYYYHEEGLRENANTLKQLNDTTFIYFDKVQILVPSDLTSAMNEIIFSNVKRRGSFIFIGSNNLLLVRFLD